MLNDALLDDNVEDAVVKRDDDGREEALVKVPELMLIENFDVPDDIHEDVLTDELDGTLADFAAEFWVFVRFSSVRSWSSSSSLSSSSFRLLAKSPRLSKTVCILGKSGGSASNKPITSSKPLLRHPRSLKMLKILAPPRQESYDGGGSGGCKSSKSLKIRSSVNLILLTNDSFGPSSSRIDDIVFASSVILKITPTNNKPCELAADPVGFQNSAEMAGLGGGVMVLG